MKQLTCEMCGGTDLVKDGGVFVCQTCGCKYSIEEVKKMMVEGTVDVKGTVKIDNTAQIQNYLDLSQNAYDSGNGQSAFDYANKALEIAPQHSRAWIAKMKAIEYIGTLGDLKLIEVVEAGKNAVTYASEEEKEEITHEVYFYELTRALSLLKLAMNKIADTDDIKSTYKQFCLISLLSASKNTMQVDSKITNIYEGIVNEAMALVMLVPDEVLADYSDLAKIAGQCALQYEYETNAFKERLAIYGASLTDGAIKARAAKKKEVEDKAKAAEKIALKKEAKIKAEKKAAYWAEHAAEKAELEAKQNAAIARKAELEAEWGQIPEHAQKKDIYGRIASLEAQMKGLGLFKGKEKKALQAQIDDIKKSLAPIEKALSKKKSDLQVKIDRQAAIIAEVNAEFAKDR